MPLSTLHPVPATAAGSSLVRVLAADPRPLMLRGIQSTLDGLKPFIEVIATTADYDAVPARCERLEPDLVMITALPDPAPALRLLAPLVERARARVLLLLDGCEARLSAADAAGAGASGAARAQDTPEQIAVALLQAIRSPLRTTPPGKPPPAPVPDQAQGTAGSAAMPPPVIASLPAGIRLPAAATRLTGRELQVIRAIVAHPSAKYLTIGALLNVSEHTVHNHLTSIYQKLNLVNRTDLLHFAIRHQLAELRPAAA